MSLWTIPILAYHRVGEPKGDHVPTVTPEGFERQLDWLARWRIAVLDLPELVATLANRRPVPRRSAVITFDDGYVETATIASGLLHTFGFRATVFVTPNEMGLPGFMNWDQVRAVAGNGMTIGSHTLHHAFLPVIPREKVRMELVESKAAIEQQLGRPIQLLSYPVGGFNAEIQRVAKEAGYQAACTTNRGMSKRMDDLFALRRIKMNERDSHPLLCWAKLSGYYDLFRRLEPPG